LHVSINCSSLFAYLIFLERCQYLQLECAAETRFYGAFIVAERMIELKEAVQQTVVSSAYSGWAAAQSAKVKAEAAAVKSICLNEEGFWKAEAQLVEIFGPIVNLLRLTDSALPAISKVNSCASQHKVTSCS
jgi:hypothetical protein